MRPARRSKYPWSLLLQQLTAFLAATVSICCEIDNNTIISLLDTINNASKLISHGGTIFVIQSDVNKLKGIRLVRKSSVSGSFD